MLATLVVRAAGTGDVDPLGGIAGSASLVAGIWAGVMARRTLVWQDTDTAGLADRLAPAVARQEAGVRHRLLGGDVRTIDVGFDFVPAPAGAGAVAGAAPDGTLSAITDYYRALRPGRLIITGAAGGGKTVLALQLMLRLLEDRRPGEPVPVRLSLSGFDLTTQTLEEWITERLVRDFRLKPRAARALVVGRKVVPVLDGLDEMDPEEEPHRTTRPATRAAAALQAMNTYLDGTGLGQLIVTCRSTAYEVLEAGERWAQDAARITIRPITAEVAWDFLAARTGGMDLWEPVMEAIAQEPEGPLARALATPWYLTVAATVYQPSHRGGIPGIAPSELLDPELTTETAIRDHLLRLLVPAATSTARGPYTTDQVQAWLGVLAVYLNTNTVTNRSGGGRRLPGTDLVLHELWPLAGNRPRTLHTYLTLLILALLTVVLTSTGREPVVEGALMGVPFALLALLVAAQTFWPAPSRLDWAWLRNSGNLLGLGLFLVIFGWLVAVLVMMGVTVAFAVAVTVSEFVAGGFGTVPVVWVLVVFASVIGWMILYAFVMAMSVLLVRESFDAGVVSSVMPRDVIRADLRAGAVFGTAFGAVAMATVMGMITLWAGIGAGGKAGAVAVFGVAAGAWAAPARYVAFLLATRQRWASGRWLPWRLGRFLDWCCGVGLMRTAGVAYQFRHRELQEFLARTAVVPALSASASSSEDGDGR
ncbi:NACHT domain-containing protein [Streptomyces sp. bgisy034]|uniref:NACHT domain-containing protein n=1 Tax=Streptomyces sp. bgisy034 TaxID=3413774 RepID=UPI003EC0C69D